MFRHIMVYPNIHHLAGGRRYHGNGAVQSRPPSFWITASGTG